MQTEAKDEKCDWGKNRNLRVAISPQIPEEGKSLIFMAAKSDIIQGDNFHFFTHLRLDGGTLTCKFHLLRFINMVK